MAPAKIRKTPGISDGAACIGRTQIPVWKLIDLRLQGCSDLNLLNDFPELSKDDLKVAFAYYAQNGPEIDDAIATKDSEN
jgi:uncharacterized protein (DUF433 family)